MVNKNKIISILCIIIILVSLIIILINLDSLTGRASIDSGYVNITVEDKIQIEFVLNSINFESGRVDLGSNSSIIDTLGNVINGTWNATTQGFILANIGSSDAVLNLKSGYTADEFIGGTNPRYEYNVTNNESYSCLNPSGGYEGLDLGIWRTVNITDPGTKICDVFSYGSSNNSIKIDVLLEIPVDSDTGDRMDIFTATAIAV